MLSKTWTQEQIIAAMTAQALREGFVVEGEIKFSFPGGDDASTYAGPHTVSAIATVSTRKPTPRKKGA